MVLGERMPDVGLRLGWPFRWPTALAAASGVGVLPDYDARPEPMLALLALGAPSGLALLGIDRDTAVIGWNGAWEVHGIARVTVWRGRHRERHRRGDAFRLEDDAACAVRVRRESRGLNPGPARRNSRSASRVGRHRAGSSAWTGRSDRRVWRRIGRPVARFGLGNQDGRVPPRPVAMSTAPDGARFSRRSRSGSSPSSRPVGPSAA